MLHCRLASKPSNKAIRQRDLRNWDPGCNAHTNALGQQLMKLLCHQSLCRFALPAADHTLTPGRACHYLIYTDRQQLVTQLLLVLVLDSNDNYY